MASVTKRAGSASNIQYPGSDWTDVNTVDYVTDSYTDAQYVQNDISKGDVSDILRAYNFGFSIPADATIDGIIVSIKADGEDSTMKYNVVQLYGAAGFLVGSNLSDGSSVDDAYAGYKDFGSSTNLWGTTWSDSDINDQDFGFGLVVQNTSTSLEYWCRAYDVKITVYYTESPNQLLSGNPSESGVTATSGSVVANTPQVLTGISAESNTESASGVSTHIQNISFVGVSSLSDVSTASTTGSIITGLKLSGVQSVSSATSTTGIADVNASRILSGAVSQSDIYAQAGIVTVSIVLTGASSESSVVSVPGETISALPTEFGGVSAVANTIAPSGVIVLSIEIRGSPAISTVDSAPGILSPGSSIDTPTNPSINIATPSIGMSVITPEYNVSGVTSSTGIQKTTSTLGISKVTAEYNVESATSRTDIQKTTSSLSILNSTPEYKVVSVTSSTCIQKTTSILSVSKVTPEYSINILD